jgi:probable addiction module antidote protein
LTKEIFEPLDLAEYATAASTQAHLLEDAFAENDPAYLAQTLGIIARARGMSQVAKDAGVTREALYKALTPEGDPKLSTLFGVIKALGLKLTLTPIDTKP